MGIRQCNRFCSKFPSSLFISFSISRLVFRSLVCDVFVCLDLSFRNEYCNVLWRKLQNGGGDCVVFRSRAAFKLVQRNRKNFSNPRECTSISAPLLMFGCLQSNSSCPFLASLSVRNIASRTQWLSDTIMFVLFQESIWCQSNRSTTS